MARRRKLKELDIDVSSFSDIAFLLIIFFILTTSLARPLGRVIDVPSAAKPEAKKADDKTPSINVLPDRIVLGEGEGAEREVTLTELRADLVKRRLDSAAEKDRMVVVEIGEDVAYERYFQVITMVAEAGGVVAMLTE